MGRLFAMSALIMLKRKWLLAGTSHLKHSWIPGNNRCWDWGLTLSRITAKSQGLFHLSRLIILVHSALRELVICALKLPLSNNSSTFCFEKGKGFFGALMLDILSLAENKSYKKNKNKKNPPRCMNLLKIPIFSFRYSTHVRAPVKAFPQISKSSHLASLSYIADIDVIVVVGWMNTCSTPTLAVMSLFACRQEIWPLWRKKKCLLWFDFREGRASDQCQQVQK